jgi:hypothetical protein
MHQAATDAAALTLAQRKLTASFGQRQSWHDTSGALLTDVANGKVRLLRATFSLGTLTGPLPRSLHISRLDAVANSDNWTSNTVWAAPADSTMPGRSVFALLDESDIGEGERLIVHATLGGSESGVLVPQAAVVISEGKYWCYVERQPGTFTRVAIDARRPQASGYFVKDSIAAGTPVVIAGAGLLLASETGSVAEAD